MTTERKCIGCRRRAAPAELVRIIAEGREMAISRYGPGRGAWLCPRVECFDEAARRRAFTRALRTDLDPGSDLRLRVAFVRELPHARG